MKRIILFILLLSIPAFASTDVVELLDHNDNSLSTVNAWDNITVKVTNSDANTDASSIDAGTVKVNSTKDSTGITITVIETGVNTGIFEGFFWPVDDVSDDINDYINSTDGTNVTAIADLDNDGNSGTDSVIFEEDPDEITAYKLSSYRNSSNEFSINDIVYVEIISKSGITPRDVNISSDSGQSITISVTESSAGKYRGYFRLMRSTSDSDDYLGVKGGENFTITSDLENDDTADGNISLNVKDDITTYIDSYTTPETYFKTDDTVYVQVNNSAHSGASSIRVISDSDSSGINVALSEIESGIFRGTFSIKTVSNDANDEIKAVDGDGIQIIADLDSNNLINQTKNITADTVAPSSATYLSPSRNYQQSGTKEIRIRLVDNFQLNSTIKLYYWRAFKSEDKDNDGVIDLGEYNYTTMRATRGTNSVYAVNFSDGGLSSGHQVKLWIGGEDAAGNSINASVGGNWTNPIKTYTIDNNAPTVNIISPPSTYPAYRNKFNLSFNWNDTGSSINLSGSYYQILYKGNSEKKVYLTSANQSGKTINNIALSGLTGGKLEVKVYAVDMAANSVSQSVYIRNNNSAYAEEDDEDGSAPAGLEIISSPETIKIEQGDVKEFFVSINNTGDVEFRHLGINMTLDFYNVSLNITRLNPKSRDNFIIKLSPSFNQTIGNYSSVITVYETLYNISNTTSISIEVTAGSILKKKANDYYSNFSSSYDNLANRIKNYNEENFTNVKNVKNIITEIGNDIDSMKSLIDSKKYTDAVNMASKIETKIETANNEIIKIDEKIDIDYSFYLIIGIIIACLAVFIYLMWPTK